MTRKIIEKMMMLTDKTAKIIFTAGNDEFKINEDGKNKTQIQIDKWKGMGDDESFNDFDKQIFNYLIASQQYGNEFATLREIHINALNGSETHFTKIQKERILHSVRKLAFSRVYIEMNQKFIEKNKYKPDEKFNKNSAKKTYSIEGVIFPCKIDQLEIHGQKADIIVFLGDSPLLAISEMKNQLSKIDKNLIAIPHLKSTEIAIKLTTALLSKINDVKRSWIPNFKTVGRGKNKQIVDVANYLNKSIKFDTLFSQCNLTSDKKHHDRYRKMIEKILNHFQNCGFITEWHFEKSGREFYKIAFDFPTQTQLLPPPEV